MVIIKQINVNSLSFFDELVFFHFSIPLLSSLAALMVDRDA